MRPVKQRVQQFQQTEHKEPVRKKQRIGEHQTRTEIRVNPEDTSRIQKGKSLVTTVREATGLSKIPPTAHELVAILQFSTQTTGSVRKNGTRT